MQIILVAQGPAFQTLEPESAQLDLIKLYMYRFLNMFLEATGHSIFNKAQHNALWNYVLHDDATLGECVRNVLICKLFPRGLLRTQRSLVNRHWYLSCKMRVFQDVLGMREVFLSSLYGRVPHFRTANYKGGEYGRKKHIIVLEN